MLDILEDFCMMRGFEYCRLDGSTNRVQRRLDIRRFNAAGRYVYIYIYIYTALPISSLAEPNSLSPSLRENKPS
jgi:hypothetical protein